MKVKVEIILFGAGREKTAFCFRSGDLKRLLLPAQLQNFPSFQGEVTFLHVEVRERKLVTD